MEPASPFTVKIVDDEIHAGVARIYAKLTTEEARHLADQLHDAADLLENPTEQSGVHLSTNQLPAKSMPNPADVAAKMTDPASTVTPPLFRRSESTSIGFSMRVREFMEDNGILQDEIEEVIANPHSQWEGISSSSWKNPTIAVRDDIAHGAVYFVDPYGDNYVVSVQPRFRLEDQRRELTGGQPSFSGGPRRAAIDSLDVLVKAVRSQGLEFEQGKNHGKIFDPLNASLGCYTVPLTPSDHRAYVNAAADLRKKFDIEL